jgi:hypothetical protein
LLELLVSMSVLSLLATTVLFGWRIAAGSWGRVNTMVDEQRRVESVQQVLERQIADMVPVAPWLRQGSASVLFQGEREAARFVSRYSLLHRGRSGLYQIEYQIMEADGGGKQLLLNESPMRSASDVADLLIGTDQTSAGTVLRFAPMERNAATRVLLENAAELYFEYYRPASGANQAGWVDQWTARVNEVPRAMAIRVTPAPGRSRLQPVPVVVAIRNYSRSTQ